MPAKAKFLKCLVMILIAAMIMVSGCASKTDKASARGLNPSEAEKLLAIHSSHRNEMAAEDVPEMDIKADPAALERHGDLLARQGELSAALFQYRRAVVRVKKAGDKMRILRKVADIHLASKNYRQAANYYSRLTEKGVSNAQVMEGLGLSELALGEVDKAAEHLKSAVKLNPDSWKSHTALGVIENRNGEPDKALAQFKTALNQGGNQAMILNNTAISQIMLNDLPGAEATLKRALSMSPDYTLASNNLALVLTSLGRINEAYELFSRTMGQAQAHNNMGCLLYWRGQTKESAAQFQAALEKKPTFYSLAAKHLDMVNKPAPGKVVTVPALPASEEKAISVSKKRDKIKDKALSTQVFNGRTVPQIQVPKKGETRSP